MSTPSPSTSEPFGPLVSVILPTHNRSALLRRAIESVLAQTYRNFELIVVDDASTDDTPAVVHSYADARISYIRQPTNARAAAARNAGIKSAKGEFIAFQDDDDEWLPVKLERQVAALMRAPPEVGLHLSGFQRIEAEKEFYVGREFYLDQLDFAKTPHADFALLSTPNWLVRRPVLERAGLFDERIKSLDDWELALRMLDHCRFELLDEPLWIQHWARPEGAGMVRNEKLIVNDYPIIVEKHGARWGGKTIARYYFQTGRMHASLGDAGAGARWLWRAVRNDPMHLKAWVLLAASAGGGGVMRAAIALGRRITMTFRRISWWLTHRHA